MVKRHRQQNRMGVSEKALKVLSGFLDSEYTPKECMNIVAVHGLMTSVVIGPKPIMPSRWLPVLFGESKGQRVRFINQKHASKINQLIFRMYNWIAKKMENNGHGTFEPLLFIEDKKETNSILISLSDWCGGFVQGVIMEMEAWSELTEDEVNNWLMDNILMFGTSEGLKEARNLSRDQLLERLRSLPQDIEGIYQYWLKRRV